MEKPSGTTALLFGVLLGAGVGWAVGWFGRGRGVLEPESRDVVSPASAVPAEAGSSELDALTPPSRIAVRTADAELPISREVVGPAREEETLFSSALLEYAEAEIARGWAKERPDAPSTEMTKELSLIHI